MWRVKAIVKLKEEVLDVQGRAVETAMKQLGYQDVKDLRIGKYIEFVAGREPEPGALKNLGENLFSNPIIETVEFSVEPGGEP